MSIDEAINILKQYVDYDNPDVPDFYTMEEAIKVIIKVLEQDPSYNSIKTELKSCDDAVSRQAVLEAIDVKAWEFCDYLIRNDRNDEQKPISHFAGNLRECVGEDLPSVTPQPKMGKWEWVQYDGNPNIGNWNCSECHSIGRSYFDYCPYCGAKMSEIPTGEESEG